jgi:hypothetical protein
MARWMLLLVFVPCLGGPTCGGGQGDKAAGEPCARASECQLGLECTGGVCRSSDSGGEDDAGADGGRADAAVDDGG